MVSRSRSSANIQSAESTMQNRLTAATDESKCGWEGFCEIESEPALFNDMLKRFGVKGVKVREIVSLDEDMLSLLPRPIYGLIFLYKWTPEDADQQEQSCPEDIWFANQTVNNACASVALLNIINNVPCLDLGEHLTTFRSFTRSFSPALRGDAIANFDFIKRIHNSYARKMDMLNADLLLKNQAAKKGQSSADDDGESGFHFIAFMPVDDKLWKLDGLERQPMCLGSLEGDWLNQARPDIEARMYQYTEDHIDFAVLSLVKDPLLALIASLASNVKAIKLVTVRLDEISQDWRQGSLQQIAHSHSEGPETYLHAADEMYGLEQAAIDEAFPSEAHAVRMGNCATADDFLALRQQIIADQARLKMDIVEELQIARSEDVSASSRRRDLGPKMQDFVRMVKTKEL